METQYTSFFVDFFKAIFGGYITVDSSSGTSVNINASPILMTGFILGLIALLGVIVLAFCYKNKLLNNKVFTILTISIVCLFLTAGILFIFKDTAIKTQIAQAYKAMKPEVTEETLAELLKLVHVSTDAGSLVFMVGQFFAATCVGGAYAVERLVK